MRKSLSYKKTRLLIRIWTLRLVGGTAGSYGISLGVLAAFRRFGGDAMMIVGFLTVFALIPASVLLLFSIPSVRAGSAASAGTRTIIGLVPLGLLCAWAFAAPGIA